MNKEIYFAGPLFNQAEKDFNQQFTNMLESIGFKVYLPQRDTVGELEIQHKKNQFSAEQRNKFIFEQDRDAIIKADIFLFILDGRVPDEGACVELGIAYCQQFMGKAKKLLIGLQTDIRAAFIGSQLNPMIKVPLDFIATNTDELMEHLKNILRHYEVNRAKTFKKFLQ